jgi:hypothetical protein
LDKKWAAEPWRAVPERVFIKGEDGWGSIVDAQDWFIAKLEDSLDPEANAQRIVDCVNALRGLDPAAVPAVVAALAECARVLGAAAAKPLPGAAEAAAKAQSALAALTSLSAQDRAGR